MSEHDLTKELTKSLGSGGNALHNKATQQKVTVGSSNLMNTDGGATSRAMTIVDRLFGTKEATFWSFQFFGWSGYGLVRTFQAVILEYQLSYYVMLIIAAIVIGVSMTIVLRHIYRLIREQALPFVLLVVVFLCSTFGLLFSSLELAMAPIFIPQFQPVAGLGLFGNAMFEATALFAWSAIYFGYHYYAGLQEQKAHVLKATAMAHQAQLKMLRYQLNPHFLFNTLNAISTLVLEKSEDDANKMLTKLSSFLRYTLVNQPTQRISLDQELYALGLYLDIEKVRFEERLNIEYDIDEQTKAALVPSLILQPLIENAIKYAVAPAIDGGTVQICAKLKGDNRLCLSLTDNGPGMPDINHIVSQSGSGVGIANTKERLAQIYGDDHTLTLKNVEPTGLKITIEIPLERERSVTRAGRND